MQPRVSQYCITLTLARCGSIQTIVENWRLIADFGEGLGYWQFTPPVRIQIWFTVIQRSSFHHGNRNDNFCGGESGGDTREVRPPRIWVSGVQTLCIHF